MSVLYEKFLRQMDAIAQVAFAEFKEDCGTNTDDVFLNISVGAEDELESLVLSFGALTDLETMLQHDFNLSTFLREKLTAEVLGPITLYVQQLPGRHDQLTHVSVEVEFGMDDNKYGVHEVFVALTNLLD